MIYLTCLRCLKDEPLTEGVEKQISDFSERHAMHCHAGPDDVEVTVGESWWAQAVRVSATVRH